jgi:predicted HTH domain antitoxin
MTQKDLITNFEPETSIDKYVENSIDSSNESENIQIKLKEFNISLEREEELARRPINEWQINLKKSKEDVKSEEDENDLFGESLNKPEFTKKQRLLKNLSSIL